MITQDITLVGDSASTRLYTQTAGPTEGNPSSVRKNAAAPVGELESLTVRHGSSTRAGTTVDTHMTRLDLGKVDATTQKQHVGSVHIVLTVPRVSVITNAQISDMIAQLKAFLSIANIAKLLNGEA